MNLVKWLENIAGSFQPAADKIRALKWNAQQQAVIDKIWANLAPSMQNALWALISMVIAKFGPAAGQEVFINFLNWIKEKGYIVS